MTYLQDNDFSDHVEQQEMQEMRQLMMVSPRKKATDYGSHMSCIQGKTGGYGGGMNHFLGVTTWVVFMALLVAATRYLWNKGGEKK